jgi:adenylate cyclase
MGGTVDKIVGDSVVAMFGAPLPLPDHALHACVAALETQRAIAEFRERLKQDEGRWPEIAHRLRVRIGINSGSVMVGNVGSKTRFNFTMMGDEVNLAARLESGAKSWGVWTLCAGATKRACEKAEPGRVLFRRLGQIIVKGRADRVEIFEPVALAARATDAAREGVDLFERGLVLLC